MSDSSKAGGSGKAARTAGRRRRLSVALRENLKRRKAQAKGRVAAETAVPSGPQPSAAPHDSAGFADDKRNK